MKEFKHLHANPQTKKQQSLTDNSSLNKIHYKRKRHLPDKFYKLDIVEKTMLTVLGVLGVVVILIHLSVYGLTIVP